MAEPLLEYEGIWEEILSHSSELAGRRVRVVVLDEGQPLTRKERASRMLAALDEWEKTLLPEEERRALDEFEAHLREHPVLFRDMEES